MQLEQSEAINFNFNFITPITIYHDVQNWLKSDSLDINKFQEVSLDARVPPDHPSFTDITKQCRIMINAIHKDRTRKLRAMDLVD